MKQRYDSYKSSGIDWIGDIPSHWDICTLKQASNSIRNGYVGPTKDILVDDGIPYFQSLHVKDGKLLFDRGEYYVTKKWADKHPKIYKDDIVIVQTGDIGQVAIVPSEYDGCNCHALIIVVSDKQKITPQYLLYYLRSSIGKELMLLTKTGATLPHLNSGSICNTQLILPPLAEQEAIAAWLDEKCQVIDAAIAKVDREIELIDELKQSEISRVVTRGLNPDAPLRSSGIDWIGDIPEHWEICKIKHRYHIQTGFTPATKNHEYYDPDNGFIWLTIGDIKEETVSESSNKISSKYVEEFAPELTPKGSLLYSFKLSVGQVCFAGTDLYTNEAIASFINSPNINLNFLKYSSSLIINNANINIYGAPILNQELIKNAPIIFPPLSEQQEIADYLDKKCAEIDGLKAKLTKKRETLTELRQSIISEVVTGKRKVI